MENATKPAKPSSDQAINNWVTIIGAFVAGLLVALGVFYLVNTFRTPKADTITLDGAQAGGRGGFGEGRGGFRGAFQQTAGAPTTQRAFGGPGGPGGFAGFRDMAFGRDALGDIVQTLGELSLKADFTLTADQKGKIQSIRDSLKETQTKWQKDHEADFQKISDEFRAARENGGRDQLQAIMEKRQALQATAPKTEDYVTQIKAVLTQEQVAIYDARITERRNEAEQMRRQMEERMAGFGGRGDRGGDRDRNNDQNRDRGGRDRNRDNNAPRTTPPVANPQAIAPAAG